MVVADAKQSPLARNNDIAQFAVTPVVAFASASSIGTVRWTASCEMLMQPIKELVLFTVCGSISDPARFRSVATKFLHRRAMVRHGMTSAVADRASWPIRRDATRCRLDAPCGASRHAPHRDKREAFARIFSANATSRSFRVSACLKRRRFLTAPVPS